MSQAAPTNRALLLPANEAVKTWRYGGKTINVAAGKTYVVVVSDPDDIQYLLEQGALPMEDTFVAVI